MPAYRADPLYPPLPPGKAEIRFVVGLRTADGAAMAGARFLVPEGAGVALMVGVVVGLLLLAALTA